MSHVLDDPDMQKKIEEFRHVSRMRKDFNMIQSQADTYLLPGFVIQPRKQTSILREQQRLLGCAGVVEAGANNPTDAPPRSLIDCPIQTPLSYSDICKFPKQIRVGDQMVEFYDYVTSSEFDRLLSDVTSPTAVPTESIRFAQSPFKGGFICDDTGLGKSLTALLTALKLQEEQRPRCGFILVVCLTGCLTQWATEIKKHFKPENRPSYIILQDATYPVQKLLEYDIVICTPQFVQKRYDEVQPYLHRQVAMQAMISTRKKIPSEALPHFRERPHMPLHSLLYNPEHLDKNIAVLILDESHRIRNPDSKTYQAIQQLRYHFALLLSATPMYDNWTDMPKQMGLLPGGGPFLDEQHMNLVLDTGTYPSKGGGSFQKKVFERFAPALAVGRPKRVLDDLPKPIIKAWPVEQLERWVELAVAFYVRKGRQYLGIGTARNQSQRQNSTAGFAMLSIASQLTSNPLILQASNPPKVDVREIHNVIAARLAKEHPDVTHLDSLSDAQWFSFKTRCSRDLEFPYKATLNAVSSDGALAINSDGDGQDGGGTNNQDPPTLTADDAAGISSFIVDEEGVGPPPPDPTEEVETQDEDPPLATPVSSHVAKASAWKQKLSLADENIVMSPRVRAVIDCVEQIYSNFPGQNAMVVASSLLFLHVISEAIKRRLPRLDILEYNGNVDANERASHLMKINNSTSGTSILVLTADAGGTGLNVTGVNHIIMAQPTWSPGLDEQIIGRSNRLGQKHQVYVYKLHCQSSEIDKLLGNINTKKGEVIKPIRNFLIREDREPFIRAPLPPKEELRSQVFM
ncbi:unnamed protein product [Clonostachys rosea f. rosea IK726]|uniref:Uncharacterized protein n=1 Tax=Clonostachys rosea f. rosea IK726 TaxID=1349383 RepID=A0ACA9T8W6_BIOOC|nr:unnamed protein product [Clonostachys rosea f. rosea IK726]